LLDDIMSFRANDKGVRVESELRTPYYHITYYYFKFICVCVYVLECGYSQLLT